MREEFAVYGLSSGMMKVIGVLKVSLGLCLILGLWLPSLTRPAAIAVAALMLGAVAMHLKVKDPLKSSLPALTLLVLAIVVALF
ncbi:MAG: DoxX family protein [Acidobacteria bacterium]|nr:DoxX family protein [Acidobacteriota bacterium]